MNYLALMLFFYLSLIPSIYGLGYDVIGCFPKSALTGLTSKGKYQWQSSGYCEGQCVGNLVIALTDGDECFCGSGIDKSAQVSSSFCSQPCSGYPVENCGSDDSNYFHVILDAEMNSALEAESSSSSSTSTSTSSSSSSSSTTTSSSSTSTSSSSTTSSSETSSSTTLLTTTATPTSTSSSSSDSSASETADSDITMQESSITTVLSSESVFTSNQELITIVHSVTSVSIQTQTATAIRTATVVPSAPNNNSGINANNKSSQSSSGLSHGAIAGIVVGAVIGTLLIAAFLLWFFGVTLFCIPGRNKTFDPYDDEKSLSDGSLTLHRPVDNSAALAGLNGFGRTAAYEYNADEISIGYGNRRFSQGSLPDAAGGSESDSSNKGGGLRVINPDL